MILISFYKIFFVVFLPTGAGMFLTFYKILSD